MLTSYFEKLTENNKYCNSSILVPVFIVFSVYIFNFHYIFFDGLFHDDGLWFFKATGGDPFHPEWRGKVSVLTPFRDYFYSMGMLWLGTELLHVIYVGIMALSSWLVFVLFHNVFGINKVIAVPAAIVPNILPSLMIPLSFNATYALWTITPLLLSLILIYKTNSFEGAKWHVSYWLAFLLYLVALNMSGSGTFVIPNAILFFFLFSEKQKISNVILKALPFVIYGIYHIYKHKLYGKKTPVVNSLDVVLDRTWQFVETSNVFLIGKPYSTWIILCLSLVGFVGLYGIGRVTYNIFER